MRFYGVIGYGIPEEDEYGVVTLKEVEHSHFGEMTKVTSRNEGAQQLNDNIRLNNSFSIVRDAFITDFPSSLMAWHPALAIASISARASPCCPTVIAPI